MMGSLRLRLVLALVLLAGAGLVAVAAIVYTEQRSFLLQRVDSELKGAQSTVSQDLDAHGFGVPGQLGNPGGDPGGHGAGGHGPGGGHDGPNGFFNLPPGTYGERRSASGQVLGHIQLQYGSASLGAPSLPPHLTVGRIVSVPSAQGDGPGYRAVALADPEDPGVTVVAIPLGDVHDTLHRLLGVEAIVVGVVLAALGVLSWLVVRLGLRPLERMEAAAGAIAAGELDRRVSPATPRTEVGRLGLALNTMLERLQQAFQAREASEDRLRQFLADASHELRTPLVSIRGYAELFRMGALSDPDDAARALAGIESESARMGRLVEDLLALARLDEVREAVREPVDLAELATAAVEAARVGSVGALVPEREITLTTDPGPLTVTGDAHELRRVIDNLLRNAMTHTPEGTPIEVHLTRTPDPDPDPDRRTVTLTVRDHGHGLPTDDTGALFERFWRAEPGRGRGKGGAGLGLAIVDTIISGHGGTVAAANAPDGGAIFTVALPA